MEGVATETGGEAKRRMESARKALGLPRMVQRSLSAALAHDCLNLSQSAAYSAVVALFPALVVMAAVIAFLPDATPIKYELGAFFARVLPSEVLPLIDSYFASSPKSPHTVRAVALAGVVSLSGASSVIATLMEGLRRAAELPNDCWTFWQRRGRALALVPMSLLPLVVATMLVMFGQEASGWLAQGLPHSLQAVIYAFGAGARWCIALAAVVGVTALIYHMGTPKQQRWVRVLPGAVMATAMWFVTTLAFGWYVTRYANYSEVYGSLGTGIALLVWMYFVFMSVLCGAEFNAQFYERFFLPRKTTAVAESQKPNALG